MALTDNPDPTLADHVVLSTAEIAIVHVLLSQHDKVVGRESLSRMAGLEADSARRVDSCLVSIRKALGHDSIVTIRRRGWMLSPSGREAGERYLMSYETITQ